MPMRWPLIVTAASVLAIAIGAAVAVMRAERRDQASGGITLTPPSHRSPEPG